MSSVAISITTLEGFASTVESGVTLKRMNLILQLLNDAGVDGLIGSEIQELVEREEGRRVDRALINGPLQNLELVKDKDRKIFRIGDTRVAKTKHRQEIYRSMKFKECVATSPKYVFDPDDMVRGCVELGEFLKDTFPTIVGTKLHDSIKSKVSDMYGEFGGVWRPTFQVHAEEMKRIRARELKEKRAKKAAKKALKEAA